MGVAEHFGPRFCGLGKLTGNCARQATAMKWRWRRRRRRATVVLSFVRSFFSDLGSSGKRIRSASLSLLGGGGGGGGGHAATGGRIGTRTNERTMEGAPSSLAQHILRRQRHALCESELGLDWICRLRCRRARPPLLLLRSSSDFSSRRGDPS